MLVKDVGEFKLIEMLAEAVKSGEPSCVDRAGSLGFRLRLSIGDDAAAWDGPPVTSVVTTDTLVEDVHFSLGRISWTDLGWKSMAVNLSDIAAMGCAPLCSVITLGLRGDLPVNGLLDMYRGMAEACEEYGGTVVGGDIVRSPVFFVTVAMVGVAPVSDVDAAKEKPRQARRPFEPAGRILTRSSSRPGDRIAVTGRLGCSGGGLRMLLDDLSFDDEVSAHLRNAHNRPVPRVAQGMVLARHGVAAAIDVSDGLVDDLAKLCKASGVGARVYSDRVPVDGFLKRAYPKEWLSLALSGGEDYELLFTAPHEVIEAVAPLLGVPVSVIGDIVDEPRGVAVLDKKGGRAIPVDSRGWDHFRQD